MTLDDPDLDGNARSEAAAAPPREPVMFEVFNEIGIISQLSSNTFERVMPEGMSMAQFTVLNHFVRLGGPRNPVHLARAFQVTKGAMTNTLGKLEAKGLVTVTDDPEDRRAKLVDITDPGRDMRQVCLDRLSPELQKLTALGPEADWLGALPFLRRLREWLDANR